MKITTLVAGQNSRAMKFNRCHILYPFFIAVIIAAIPAIAHAIVPAAKKMPVAVKGILDLRGWDFDKDGPVKLDGDWEFYWKQLLSSDDFKKNNSSPTRLFLSVPALWYKSSAGGKKLPDDGFATYRLIILLNPISKNQAIKFNAINSAYRGYAEGVFIASNGRVGTDERESIPEWRPHVARLPHSAEKIELILQVSNFHYIHGGIHSKMEFGREDHLSDSFQKELYRGFFIFGVLFIMGLYHLSFFMTRRKDTAPLYFGIFCLMMSIRTIASGEYPINYITPGISWTILHKMEFTSFTLAVPIFTLFIHALFREDYKKGILHTIVTIFSGMTLFIIATPEKINSMIAPLAQVCAILAIVYTIIVLIRASFKKREGARIFFIGYVLLSIAVTNDILNERNIISTGHFTQVGLFCFLFSQAFMLSTRYSRAFISIENLSDQLRDYTGNLQRMVDERTAELKHTNEELFASTYKLAQTNEALLKRNREIEDELEIGRLIMNKLLPEKISDGKRENPVVTYIPTDKIGGDFYGFKRGENSIEFLIADVSGHGLPSAFLALIMKNTFDFITDNTLLIANPKLIDSPSKLMEIINNTICASTVNDKFITAFYCILDYSTMIMHYCSTGHLPLLLHRSASGEIIELHTGGKPLGWFKNYKFTTKDVHISPHDRIILYTDGIIECLNDDHDIYGEERFINFIKKNRGLSPQDFSRILMDELRIFSGYDKFEDDVTLIVYDVE